ncbi:GDP-mannose 4,6-dehydratase [Candidatus Pelagibacter sp.]|nr:GDP-mannose 4,6-dehydratase [Candidatus Pelagibacter sp.]
MKKALIFGVNGQDGSYLSEFLLDKKYKVHGTRRYSSTGSLDNLKNILLNKNFNLHFSDITDSSNIHNLIAKCKPDEVYNLAAQSHVHVSFFTPEHTSDVDALGHLRVIEACRKINKKIKIYNASTSEIFGSTKIKPQNENTPFEPVSPYSVSKNYALEISRVYRKAYDMFICNGILFNHESPRRGLSFVTRKITSAIADIAASKIKSFSVGNLNAKRDWGYAKDYVEPMWLMLQQNKPEDYVISTGKQYTVREFISKAFKHINIDIIWRGKGKKELGINKKNKDILVKVDPYYYRPNEVEDLLGDSGKAKKNLGWKSKTDIDELIELMMRHDLKLRGL